MRALAAVLLVVVLTAAEFAASYVHMAPGHHWQVARSIAMAVAFLAIFAGDER